VDSFDKAIDGCTLVIGTTAIIAGGRDVLRKPLTPREAAKLIVGKNQKVALVIGRDGTGLSKDELEKCDVVVRIPSSERYGTLNISHALGILLYEFRMREKEIAKDDASVEFLSASEKKVIDQTLKSLVKSLKGIKGEKTTTLSLKRIFNRGIRSSIEGKALLNFLKKLDKQIKEKQISGKASE
jgi:TrmH family RNA methyltransferase